MANVNAMMVGRLGERVPIRVFAVTPGHQSGLRGHAVKAWRALNGAIGILRCGAGGAKTFYGSVDDRLGGLYTSAFVLAARLFGMRVYLHHHSFGYVDRTTAVMRLVSWAAGTSAHHIVLCPCMGEKLQKRYKHVTNVTVSPNSIDGHGDAGREPGRPDGSALRIGLLSNLTFEKGLATFVDLIRMARDEGLDVRGMLAGPFGDAKSEAFYREAQASMGDALTWHGGLYGEAKDAFLSSVDVFVFPTQYASEAYPLVILEALLHGCPVIANDRGCIGEFAKLESCLVVPQGKPFAEAALRALRQYLAEPRSLALARSAAAMEGERLNRANSEATRALLDTLAGGPQ